MAGGAEWCRWLWDKACTPSKMPIQLGDPLAPVSTSCWVLPDASLCHLHGSLREAEGQGQPMCCLATCMLHFTGGGHPAVVIQSLNRVQLFSTPWTAAYQASLSFTISHSLLKYLSFTFFMDVYFVTMCYIIMNLSNLRLLLVSNILL